MEISKLKHISKHDQIVAAIEKGADFGGDLWQTGPNGRLVFHILKIQANLHLGAVAFKLLDMSGVDSSIPVFVRLCYRNIIFRIDPSSFKVVGDMVICEYPREARGLEPRSCERYVLPYNASISLSLQRAERVVRSISLDIEVRIIDVSEKGFGILISGANRDFLKKYDRFWIKAIDQKTLHNPLFGTVTYVSPKGYYLKKGDVRVGLSLRSEISYEVFEYLKGKCHMILEA